MSVEKLVMTFEANTIKHLGVKMYSNMPPALAELIANAYDACATEVHVCLYDGAEKKVIVEDNGIGMSFDQVNNYFLRIGRNRREENQESQCDRVPTGKKGLGKLALFGIGDTINITTSQGEDGVSFNLDWNEILHWKGKDYEPKFQNLQKGTVPKGTKITLSNLKSVPWRIASTVGFASTSGCTPSPVLGLFLSITKRKSGNRKRTLVSGKVTSGISQAELP